MAISKTKITGDIALPDGSIPSKSSVTFVMTGFDTDAAADATIAPRSVTSVLSDSGALDVDLWSNEDGVRSTLYNVRLNIYNGNSPKIFDVGKIEVPTTGGPYDLNDLLPIAPPSGATVEEYIAQLAASVAAAEDAADTAVAAATPAQVLIDNIRVTRDTFAELASITPSQLEVGDYAHIASTDAWYQRAADAATDADLDYSGSGGVKLNLVQIDTLLSLDIGCSGDGATDNLAKLTEAFTIADVVRLVPHSDGNVIGISDYLTVPAGKRLEVHRAVSLKLLSTGSNNASKVVMLEDGAAISCKGTLNGNLLAREISGELTVAGPSSEGHVFGVVMRNVSNAICNVARYADVGCTDASFSADGANGGGALIDMTSSATADVSGNHVGPGEIVDSIKHGFMWRIRSDFTDVGEGDLGYYCQFNSVQAVRGAGGSKNCGEIVGPHTRFNTATDCVASDPTGQAGFECDFGAYGNIMQRMRVNFSSGFTIGRAFSGFNNASYDIDAKPKATRDNTFVDCGVYGGISDGTYSFRGFSILNRGTGVQFVRPVMRGQAMGAGSGQLIGLYIEAAVAKVDDIALIDPQFDGVQYGQRFIGTFGVGKVRTSGGRLAYLTKMHDVASNCPTDVVEFDGTRGEGTATAINASVEKVMRVKNCHFVGQTSTTISPQSSAGTVFEYGGNSFFCGTSSGVPVAGSDKAFVCDLGGNVFTTRLPGAAITGTNGRAVASGRNHVTDPDLWTSAIQRGRLIADARPVPASGKVINWAAGDGWDARSPSAGATYGETVVASGTDSLVALSGVTADTTSGSPVFTVNDASGLSIGNFITIAGALSVGRIVEVDGTTITVNSSASVTATVSGAAVSYRAPTWESYEKRNKVNVPSTSTSAGLPGQWAADISYHYSYIGDGTTHNWRRVAHASW